jgi:hypothetical protein
MLENIILSPSKQLVLDIALTERINRVDEVVVSAGRDKGQAMNEMGLVSARTFSVEETRRFAGSWQDPARAAAAFAGVTVGSDERNDIIVRGNSPTSVLWRLEGINIPNPNHLSFSGATGGPVSILNNNMLDDSDFFTGAFPAEYGNANAGAFDLSLRKGNNEKREYYLQIGLNGLEAGVSKGRSPRSIKASYLASLPVQHHGHHQRDGYQHRHLGSAVLSGSHVRHRCARESESGAVHPVGHRRAEFHPHHRQSGLQSAQARRNATRNWGRTWALRRPHAFQISPREEQHPHHRWPSAGCANGRRTSASTRTDSTVVPNCWKTATATSPPRPLSIRGSTPS